MRFKKIYTPKEVLDGGLNYNSNYYNPNYKMFVQTAKELYIIIEMKSSNDGYCAQVVDSNFYEKSKIYFAINMYDPLLRKQARWEM